MLIAGSTSVSPSVSAMTASHLNGLKLILENKTSNEEMTREYKAFYQQQSHRIEQFFDGIYEPSASDIATVPPGEPI